MQAPGFQLGDHALRAKAAIGPHERDAHCSGQPRQGITQEDVRPTDTGGVARSQPKVGDQRHLRERRHDGPVAGFEALAGVAHPHSFLMTVLVDQGKRVQIERVAITSGRQFLHGPAVQAGEGLAGTAATAREEPREGRLAGHGLDAQHLGHRRVMRQVGDSRQLVRAAEDTANKAQRGVGRVVGVGTGRGMRQHRAQLLPQASLRNETRPHRQSAVRGQPLIGEADPHRLHPVFGAQI